MVIFTFLLFLSNWIKLLYTRTQTDIRVLVNCSESKRHHSLTHHRASSGLFLSDRFISKPLLGPQSTGKLNMQACSQSHTTPSYSCSHTHTCTYTEDSVALSKYNSFLFSEVGMCEALAIHISIRFCAWAYVCACVMYVQTLTSSAMEMRWHLAFRDGLLQVYPWMRDTYKRARTTAE